MKILFKAQEMLYDNGARNFLFIDVPPMQRSPLGSVSGTPLIVPQLSPTLKVTPITSWAVFRKRNGDPYENWNTELQKSVGLFAEAHPDATVFIFSAFEVFSRLLSGSRSMGDADQGSDHTTTFVDGFHPASQVHAALAKEMYNFFLHVPSSSSLQKSTH